MLTGLVRVQGVPHRLDALVVEVHAKLDPLLESLLRLVRLVNVARLPTLHPPLSVIHLGVDDPIPDRLGDDVFGVLL